MPLKLASWNVNGLRACMSKGFMDFLNTGGFNLIGLQEIKMLPEQADFSFPGYHAHWNPAEKKGYSGTLSLSKAKPKRVIVGIGDAESDSEGRVLTLEFPLFYFVNVYTPNSKDELKRLSYRMVWQDRFADFLCGLDGQKPVIVCGDLNVAHREIDLKNPRTNTKNAGFTPEEREKMTELLDRGFVDTFRLKYPCLTGAYTWWSFMGQARQNNTGWRIDYFLVSRALSGCVGDAMIYDKVFGSDHCPVGLRISIPKAAGSTEPPAS